MIEVLTAGAETTVQDYPGRPGHRRKGVPPSGPMDALSFRLGNGVLQNERGAAGLEMTLTGPTLRFEAAATICLTGAPMRAHLDGASVPFWQPVALAAGQTLALGALEGAGCRSYLNIAGGLEVPLFFGSRATFPRGGVGGYEGRPLRAGDRLKFGEPGRAPEVARECLARPEFSREWEIGVLYGPQGAPDFFTPEDIESFFIAEWTVHEDCTRAGVRLAGPKPAWARPDGGAAGPHPSRIHENAYATGAIIFAGEWPIVLGPDGDGSGQLVSPACVVFAELWKVGQLRPGDRVRFRPITEMEAVALDRAQEEAIVTLGTLPQAGFERLVPPCSAIKARLTAQPEAPEMICRAAGDRSLLVEYAAPGADGELRVRVQALKQWIEDRQLSGIIELNPGARSLQVHYDPHQLSRAELLALVGEAELEVADRAVLVNPS